MSTKIKGSDAVRLNGESADRDLSGLAAVWAKITVSGGTPSLASSTNVSSLTDDGTGIVQTNTTAAFSSTSSFSVLCDSEYTSLSGTGAFIHYERGGNRTTSSYEQQHTQNGSDADPTSYNNSAHGDLA